jgi:hypothetical protein
MDLKIKVASAVALCGVLLGGLFVVNTVHVRVEQQHVAERRKAADDAQIRKGLRTLFSGKSSKGVSM